MILGCTFGGIYVPCIYSYARLGLPHTVQVSALVLFLVIRGDLCRALLIPYVDFQLNEGELRKREFLAAGEAFKALY